MTEIVAVDIGGTHARFAVGHVAGGRVVSLEPETVLQTAEHASLQTAWGAFERARGGPLPGAAAIAVACPVDGPVLQLTNNHWVIQPSLLRARLGVQALEICNDFTAVGHAAAQVEAGDLVHLCGPDVPLPADGVTSIVGPGTGLGVAMLLRQAGDYRVLATEGGHTDYAPLDGIEDLILQRLRGRLRRVSVERVVSGPGLRDIHAVLAELEGEPCWSGDDKGLWTLALAGEDPLAAAAFDRFGQALGSVAGDIALAQGASGVVIAGGLGLRIAKRLGQTGFHQRFIAKGRFETRMAALPVKLLVHPQPGLYGAAAAFAKAHTS